MVDLVINVVKDLGVNGQSFKAWKSGEKVYFNTSPPALGFKRRTLKDIL